MTGLFKLDRTLPCPGGRDLIEVTRPDAYARNLEIFSLRHDHLLMTLHMKLRKVRSVSRQKGSQRFDSPCTERERDRAEWKPTERVWTDHHRASRVLESRPERSPDSTSTGWCCPTPPRQILPSPNPTNRGSPVQRGHRRTNSDRERCRQLEGSVPGGPGRQPIEHRVEAHASHIVNGGKAVIGRCRAHSKYSFADRREFSFRTTSGGSGIGDLLEICIMIVGDEPRPCVWIACRDVVQHPVPSPESRTRICGITFGIILVITPGTCYARQIAI